MAYDTTSPDTGTIELDQRSIDRAASLAACEDKDQILAWLADAGRTYEPDHAYAAAFGTLTSITGELLAIIARQRDEIASLSCLPLEQDQADDDDLTDVEMVCAACRKRVIPSGHDWIHANGVDIQPCSNRRNGPVVAMVAAGNESVPRA